MRRKIFQIDEEKCDGCRLCVPSCAEGAIQIIDGKARLVSEVYCDGLGACLGECPQGAISIEEREAEAFDEGAVREHLAKTRRQEAGKAAAALEKACPPHGGGGCPGALARTLQLQKAAPNRPCAEGQEERPSALRNWPVQLALAPVKAPFFQGAKLLVAADCVPFALAGFHERFLEDRTLLIGCPKLDDVRPYVEKLAQIFAQNEIRSVDVVFMEVPCCYGLVQLVRMALQSADKSIPATFTKVSLQGGVVETFSE